MMIEEFEQRTGIYPAQSLYKVIEEHYIEFNGDKDAFCKAYRENTNGLAERIQYKADSQQVADQFKLTRSRDKISKLEKQITSLERQLEREQEWKPFESEHNIKQADYQRLAASVPGGFAHHMTDDEAKDWICQEFDFDRDKITIVHEIDEEEVNRHHQCRKTGKKIDRRPVYCATDYHYIRFNTTHWFYEVWNDSLHQYYG